MEDMRKEDVTREDAIASGKKALIKAMEQLETSKNLLVKVLKVDEEVLNDWCSEKHAEIARKYREQSATDLMVTITTEMITDLLRRRLKED